MSLLNQFYSLQWIHTPQLSSKAMFETCILPLSCMEQKLWLDCDREQILKKAASHLSISLDSTVHWLHVWGDARDHSLSGQNHSTILYAKYNSPSSSMTVAAQLQSAERRSSNPLPSLRTSTLFHPHPRSYLETHYWAEHIPCCLS